MMGKGKIAAILVILGGLVLGRIAFADSTPSPAAPPQILPEATAVVVDWKNLEGAVGGLIQANQQKATALAKAQQDATALADYWKSYVAGITTRK
jgi:hypothetical protein